MCNGISATIAPLAAMLAWSASFSGADRPRQSPPATTATVPLASAPPCAAESIPRAKPDAMTRPACPRSPASRGGELDAEGGRVARADNGRHVALQQRDIARTEIIGGGGSRAASP
jgi:hypothetical protein